MQGGSEEVSGEDVSDALLLSGQRLEAERALFQQQLKTCMSQLAARTSQVGRCCSKPVLALSSQHADRHMSATLTIAA